MPRFLAMLNQVVRQVAASSRPTTGSSGENCLGIQHFPELVQQLRYGKGFSNE